MPHQAALHQMAEALARLQQGRSTIAELSQVWRTQAELLSNLPPQYGSVMHNVLDRLESSALFTEESCSFSQKELLDNLQVWIDKASLKVGS